MTIDDLTTTLAFDRAEYFNGHAPWPVWGQHQEYTPENPDGPLWRAKLIKPLAFAMASMSSLRRLYKTRTAGWLYVQASLGEDGQFWAKVPASLEVQVLAAFMGERVE